MLLCPGRINLDDNIEWFVPIRSVNGFAYCKNCLIEFGELLEQKYFSIERGLDYHCSYDKNFEDASLLIDNIRISIINPDNLYRFPKKRSTETSLTIGLPINQKYGIVIENCDEDMYSKISIGSVKYGNDENSYYTKPERNIIIEYTNNVPELIFKEFQVVSLVIKKWKKHPDADMAKYHIIDGDPIEIKLNLMKDDTALTNMNNIVRYYNNLRHNTNKANKIIVIQNFV